MEVEFPQQRVQAADAVSMAQMGQPTVSEPVVGTFDIAPATVPADTGGQRIDTVEQSVTPPYQSAVQSRVASPAPEQPLGSGEPSNLAAAMQFEQGFTSEAMRVVREQLRTPEEWQAMSAEELQARVASDLVGATPEQLFFVANALRLALSHQYGEGARLNRPHCVDTLLQQTFVSLRGNDRTEFP